MSHYYITDETLSENRKEISFRFLGSLYVFKTIDGVFSKSDLDFGTRVLLEKVIENKIQGDVLDLGCGYGPVGVLLKKHLEVSVTSSDVNQRAVDVAKENAEAYKLNNSFVVSDGFENINSTFDYIVFNPPIRAGKKVIYRLFHESIEHLRKTGSLYIVMRKDQGALSALKELSGYTTCELIHKERGYFILKATPIGSDTING